MRLRLIKNPASRLRIKSLSAKPWLLLDKVFACCLSMASYAIHLKTDSFGWIHSILYPAIDVWERYASVSQQIKARQMQTFRVLDVGGADGKIKGFLDPSQYSLHILDINADTLKRVGDSRLTLVAGDGLHLPFQDNTFDVVVSVDSLEHVPDPRKQDYCRELQRVVKKYVIIHCPADSYSGMFQGTAYDTRFLEWHRRFFKRDESNTMEHLRSGLPKIEKLTDLFPGATIQGKQNGDVWLRYMKLLYIPYVRFVAGVFYKIWLMKRDHLPPYHACLLFWRKE